MEKGEKGLVLGGLVAAPLTEREITVFAAAVEERGLEKLKM